MKAPKQSTIVFRPRCTLRRARQVRDAVASLAPCTAVVREQGRLRFTVQGTQACPTLPVWVMLLCKEVATVGKS